MSNTPTMPVQFPAKAMIAMVGLRPLPGSPGYDGSEHAIVDRALQDIELYTAAGADAVLLENSGDLPYSKPPLQKETVVAVSHIAKLIRRRVKKPIGLQLLEAANDQALHIAAETGLDFIRAEGYVFAHVVGAGIIEGCAGKLLRLRKQLRVESIRIFADVRKKHCSHALTGDLDLAEHVRQADFFKADGIIVTGPRTGAEPSTDDLLESRSATGLPILIGSGMTPENLHRHFPHADGFIVGSALRKEGRFLGDLCPDRLQAFMDEFRRLKSAAGAG